MGCRRVSAGSWLALLALAVGCSDGSATSVAVAPTDDVAHTAAMDGGVARLPDGGGFDSPAPDDDVSSASADAEADDAPLFSWPDLPAPSTGDGGGAGGGDPVPAPPTPRAQPDPCLDESETNHSMHGTPGNDVIHGSPGRDVIFGGDGDDVIDGGGGDDVICGGNGEDHIVGGDGADYIDGGYGNDTLEGGDGDDVIHGRAGSDVIRGGRQDDHLYGDLLDDDLYGEDGNDVLIGGHGNDFMHGGDGNDWMRGDTGHDTFIGGRGFDAASFSTAMPPGQALAAASGPAPEGVLVDFNRHPNPDDDERLWNDLRERGFEAAEIVRSGLASGDGAREALMGIEAVIGSHFNDTLIATSAAQRLYGLYGDDALRGPAGTTMDGGPGADTCNDARCDPAGEAPGRPSGPIVFVDGNTHDTGIGVLGSAGDGSDQLSVVLDDHTVAVSMPTGTLTPGTGCVWRDRMQPNVVLCRLPSAPRYLMAYGGDGDDQITVVGSLPRDLSAHLGGGRGDDTLIGSAGDDVLFSGPDGRDTLVGNGGDDALLSESPAMDPMTRGPEYAGGVDHLDGGPGNDQLVSDYPCGGHFFVGGPGIDIAGFRRSTGTQRPFFGISAQLGGRSAVRQPFYGRAFNPDRCSLDPWGTHIGGDLEILEGADGDDRLYGNDENNTIWGWGGDDTMVGYDGNDELSAHDGNDELFGGDGRDTLLGGAGFDRIHARDGAPDARLDCGPNEGHLDDSDPSDPTATRCR